MFKMCYQINLRLLIKQKELIILKLLDIHIAEHL